MNKKKIIKKIREWQWSPCTHPLTCGSKSCNYVPLKAIEKESKVILKCMNCDYEQTYIPEVVLTADLTELEKLYDKIRKKD